MSTTTSSEEGKKLEKLLLEEQPHIDAALKSFASFLVAGSGSDGQQWQLTNVLTLTRLLSQTMNAHVVPIQNDSNSNNDKSIRTTGSTSLKETAARVWNNVVGEGRKPTHVLGRSTLALVWDTLDCKSRLHELTKNQDDLHVDAFCNEFEELLFANLSESANARLVWGVDQGRDELDRRARERQERAAQRIQEQAQAEQDKVKELPLIEEIEEDENEGDRKEGMQGDDEEPNQAEESKTTE